MRLGLFGSAAPRIARSLTANPQIEQRDLPPVMPPAWLVERAKAQGFDPMLAMKAMQEEPANAPMASAVPSMGMFGGAAKRAMQSAPIIPQQASAAPVNPDKGAMKQRGMMMQGPQPPQVKGGMQMAAQDNPAGAAPQASRYNPGNRDWWGEISSDPLGFFLTGTDGLTEKRSEAMAYDAAQAEKREKQAERDRLMQYAKQAGLDPGAVLAMNLNPTEFGKSYGTNYEAANVSGGDSRTFGNSRATFTAPKFGVDGGFGYTQTSDGIEWGDQRGQNYAEATSAGTLAETGRHNRATEGLDRAKFAFEQTNPKGPEFGDENSLRSQYLGQVKTFQDVARAASSVRTLSASMNPAEQMALVFQTMKMLDPTSSVRETEYANAQNTTGAYGQMWNFYNKAKDGTFLDAKQVQDFRNMIDSLYKSAEGEYGKTYDFYRGMAPRYSMDPSIIQDFRLAPNKEAFGSGAIRASQSLIPQTAAPQAPDDDTDALVQKWLK